MKTTCVNSMLNLSDIWLTNLKAVQRIVLYSRDDSVSGWHMAYYSELFWQSVSTNSFSVLLEIKKNYIWVELNLFLSIFDGMRLLKTCCSREVCPSSVYNLSSFPRWKITSTGLQKIQSLEVHLFVNLLLGKQVIHYMERHKHASPIPVQ